MAVMSKRIDMHVAEKIHMVNSDNMILLNKYMIDLSLRERAETTQYEYLTSLKQWFVYIMEHQDNRSVLDMIDDDITEFLFWCKSQGNNAARMRFRTSAISAFYKFLRKKKYMTANPTEFIEPPRRTTPIIVQTFLTSEQVAIMRERLIECGDLQLRLYAMLSLSTMARLNAIASLRWDQVDWQECAIRNVLEKEGKIVDIFFNDEVKQLLLKLKEERETKKQNDHGWLFYSGRCTDEKHINKTTLSEWCKRIGRMIGVPTLHPHDFRHSGATMLRRAGMDIEDVSTLLNHESTSTTIKYYIKQDTDRINDIKNRLNY